MIENSVRIPSRDNKLSVFAGETITFLTSAALILGMVQLEDRKWFLSICEIPIFWARWTFPSWDCLTLNQYPFLISIRYLYLVEKARSGPSLKMLFVVIGLHFDQTEDENVWLQGMSTTICFGWRSSISEISNGVFVNNMFLNFKGFSGNSRYGGSISVINFNKHRVYLSRSSRNI